MSTTVQVIDGRRTAAGTRVDPTLQNLFGRYNPPKNGASFYGGGDGTERMVAGIDKMQFESSNYYFVYGDTLFMMMDYQDQSSAEQRKAQQGLDEVCS